MALGLDREPFVAWLLALFQLVFLHVQMELQITSVRQP